MALQLRGVMRNTLFRSGAGLSPSIAEARESITDADIRVSIGTALMSTCLTLLIAARAVSLNRSAEYRFEDSTEEIGMSRIATILTEDVTRWMVLDGTPRCEEAIDHCTLSAISAAVDHLENVDVVSVSVNTSGHYDSPQGKISSLPDFCDVRLAIRSPRGHVAHVVVWAPIQWNGRFLGTTGGGNRTQPQWIQGEFMRSPTLADAVRNGFASASTDAGIRDERIFAWGLDEETGEIDWDLTENWHHRSTHEMTVAARAVIEAIYGRHPDFSYLVGTSGGGRQTLVQAQRYPADYDGYWVSCPAINWTKIHVAQMWPALVMKEHDNPLPPEKLEAFRVAAIEAFDAQDGLVDGIISSAEFKAWDPHEIVGLPTSAGNITATDAEVMRLIWDGPRDATGQRLWFGLPLGGESWGWNHAKMGLACTTIKDGRLVPAPFPLARDWIASWLLRDPGWDWTTMTFEMFEQLFRKSVQEYGSVDSSDADLSGLQSSGAKLILSHGMADEGIPPQGTVDYHDRVLEIMGGEERTNLFFRFFLCPGDGHSSITGRGPGISLASGMIALMEWVEEDHAPDVIMGSRMDIETRSITMTRPICRYPHQARFMGGDPAEASSFECAPELLGIPAP